MLTSRSLAEFALVEYNRDADFRRLVDSCVDTLLMSSTIPLGTPLLVILEQEVNGIPRAKLLLDKHHGSHYEQQWQRIRSASH